MNEQEEKFERELEESLLIVEQLKDLCEISKRLKRLNFATERMGMKP